MEEDEKEKMNISRRRREVSEVGNNTKPEQARRGEKIEKAKVREKKTEEEEAE